MILNILLKLLALSNDNIIDFKKNKSIMKLLKKEKIKDLENKLKIKFVLYYIKGFIFLSFLCII